MKTFKTDVYELEEAFFNTLMFMEDKSEAIDAFTKMINSEDGKYDFMMDYLNENDAFYSIVSDSIREVCELDSSPYYTEN